MSDLRTPYFVLDRKKIYEELYKLNCAINEYWPNTITAYSVKTNSLPYLAKLLNEQGVYAEVVSQDEYDMVQMCGFHPEHIVCNGPIKSEDFVASLMENHVMINIDSHLELDYVIKYARSHTYQEFGVGLRVNVDVEKYFPTESKAGDKGSRFGFCMENREFGDAIAKLHSCPNIYVNGLHLHVSTSTRKVEIYQWLSGLFALLVEQYNLDRISYFDIGGGFFGGMPDKPGWKEYLMTIATELRKNGFENSDITLVIEPGVSLLASAFSYYTSVLDVKETNRNRFVVTDGSRIHIDPFFHKTNYFYKHLTNKIMPVLEKQIVVGFTCLEYDDIMTLNNCPALQIGDLLRFDKLGAYTMSLSPLFISYFPAVYERLENGCLQCIRERWTAKEFIQKSKL